MSCVGGNACVIFSVGICTRVIVGTKVAARVNEEFIEEVIKRQSVCKHDALFCVFAPPLYWISNGSRDLSRAPSAPATPVRIIIDTGVSHCPVSSWPDAKYNVRCNTRRKTLDAEKNFVEVRECIFLQNYPYLPAIDAWHSRTRVRRVDTRSLPSSPSPLHPLPLSFSRSLRDYLSSLDILQYKSNFPPHTPESSTLAFSRGTFHSVVFIIKMHCTVLRAYTPAYALGNFSIAQSLRRKTLSSCMTCTCHWSGCNACVSCQSKSVCIVRGCVPGSS